VTPEQLVADPFAEEFVPVSIGRSSVAATGAWFLLGAGLIVTGVALLTGFFPARVLLDLVALWPLLGLGILVFLGSLATRSNSTSRIVAPLFVVTWLIAGLGWYATGGVGGPSLAGHVAISTEDVTEGALSLTVSGDLLFGGLTDSVAIEPQRVGGEVGPPQVGAVVEGEALAIDVTERVDAPFFQSKGWVLRLDPDVAWQLYLSANTIDLDLRKLQLTTITVVGDGVIELGPAIENESVLFVYGNITIALPAAVGAVVEGLAQGPSDWTSTDGVLSSPERESQWRVVVEEGTATFIDR
jgi:hypothetical protein